MTQTMRFQTMTAEQIIPGDILNLGYGAGNLSLDTVARVLYHDNNQPGQQDRVEIQFTTGNLSNTRTFRPTSKVQVLS